MTRPASLTFAAGLSAMLLLSACQQPITTPAYEYRPPERQADIRNQRRVAASYDDTWTGLIDYVSRTSFTIDQFEKDSGLLTLTFGENDIARYVNCGTWFESGRPEPYAGRTGQGLRLNGRMNLRVQQVEPGLTDVRITSLYILRNETGDVWQFTTNERASVTVSGAAEGTVPVRVCQSSHEAERLLITGIEAIATTR